MSGSMLRFLASSQCTGNETMTDLILHYLSSFCTFIVQGSRVTIPLHKHPLIIFGPYAPALDLLQQICRLCKYRNHLLRTNCLRRCCISFHKPVHALVTGGLTSPTLFSCRDHIRDCTWHATLSATRELCVRSASRIEALHRGH